MRMKMKNRSHIYDINRSRHRHGHRYTEYKMCLSLMMVTYIKQHLSSNLSSVHEEVQQHCC